MDYLSLKAAVAEAAGKYAGSGISDAWQAGKNSVVLSTRRGKGLILSADPVRPGLFVLDRDVLPERVPSSFTDLLRARIKGTTLGELRIKEEGERIVILTFASAWPARRGAPLELLLEVMGRRSNLMLLEEGRILQPLRTVSSDKSPARPVVAGEPYLPPPPQTGIPVETAGPEDLSISGALDNADSLRKAVRGLSPYTAMQALEKARLRSSAEGRGTIAGVDLMVATLKDMSASCTGERGFLHEGGGQVRLSPFSPVTLDDGDVIHEFSPFSEAAAFWRQSSSSVQGDTGSEAGDLERKLRERLDRISSAFRQVDLQEERCRSHNEYRVMGEALLIHAGDVKKGSRSVVLPDPYDPGLTLTIPLEAGKTPQENANDLFRQARRLKRGLEEVDLRREKLGEEKAAVMKALRALTERKDLEPARRLLEGTSAGKGGGGAGSAREGHDGPGRRRIVDGYTILVGRSAADNEKVTFKAAGPTDLWLHARDYPGSHVVILTEKRQVPDNVLYEAASLAAAGSGARGDTAPEIMVTERKWVRKLKGGKPGQVTVERFRTIRPRM